MIGKPTKCSNHGRVRYKVDWRDAHGKRHEQFFATRAEAEARQAVVNAMPHVELHPLGDPACTLREYGAHWLAANAPRWKHRTYISARAALEHHVYPFQVGARALGDLRLTDIQRPHVKALVVAMRSAGYAPDSVRVAFSALRALLNEAAEDEILAVNPVLNPGKSIRRQIAPVDDSDRVKAMTAEQLDTFLSTAERVSPRFHPLYLAGARTGMRLGELCGWRLDDLRLEEREADVRRSLGQECSMRDPHPGVTKTGHARVVDLSQQLVAVLADIKARRPALAMAQGWRPVPPWVFVTGNGTPYSQRNVLRDFDRVLLKAGFMKKGEPAPFSPHCLRHTFATLHLLNGADRNVVQYVQQQLGHSSIKVTVDTYGSWIRMRDPAAADRLDALVASRAASGEG